MKKTSTARTKKVTGAIVLSLVFILGLTACSKDHCPAYSKNMTKSYKIKGEAKMGKRMALANK